MSVITNVAEGELSRADKGVGNCISSMSASSSKLAPSRSQLGGVMNGMPINSTVSFFDVHITTQAEGLLDVLVCLEIGITLLATSGSLVISRVSLMCRFQLLTLILGLFVLHVIL